nr:response regulator transcription factor [Sphingorhabdus sp. Alg239-R122]
MDDHDFFLHGFKQYLNCTGRFSVSTAPNVQGAIELLKYDMPKIAIFDIFREHGRGMQLLEHLYRRGGVYVVHLATDIEVEETGNAMQLGIRAIARKDSTPKDMIKLMDTVLAGATDYQADIAARAKSGQSEMANQENDKNSILTKREKMIVELACQGLRNRDIAERCGLAEGTVKVHMHNIFGKLNISSRAELIVRQTTLRTA